MKDDLKILKALADDTRLKIIIFLLEKERCVCEIILKVKRTASTVSIQLSKLENAGLVKSRRDGKKVYYQIYNKKVYSLLEILGHNIR